MKNLVAIVIRIQQYANEAKVLSKRVNQLSMRIVLYLAIKSVSIILQPTDSLLQIFDDVSQFRRQLAVGNDRQNTCQPSHS